MAATTSSPQASTPATLSTGRLWASRVITAIPILLLTMSAGMKLSHAPDFASKWVEMGFPPSTLTPIGILEVVVMLTYAFPRTRVLGAILVTGYLGGATVTHVRVEQPFLIPVVLGVFAWLGVWLRDERVRALLPLYEKR